MQFKDFSGGMNLFDSDLKIADNEYCIAFNIRSRTGNIAPIPSPIEDTNVPVGKKQGLYAFDDYILIFSGGHAYYKNIITDSAWTQIAGLVLDPLVDYIYACTVPASILNLSRQLISADQVSGNAATNSVNLAQINVNGTPGGLIVQDGINQPWIILPDATARKVQTFAEWTLQSREYVPIMRQMAYVNGILFGIAPDKKTIYRSVSGRPLDFVVNVTMSGDKGGDASTTAYSVGFSEVTYLGALITGELLVGTDAQIFPVEFDYDNTIFGEPRFLNRKAFPAGVINQFSIVSLFREDGFSDYYFIDFDGIRSFSAASADNNEGRNSSFASKINKGLVTKQLGAACSIMFDNYALFSIKTTYNNDNNLIAVFDTQRLNWVCFDNHGIASIKQFAVAARGTNPTLYAITENKLYKLFASANTFNQAEISFKSVANDSLSTQIKLASIYLGFIEATKSGIVNATEIYNGEEGTTINQHINSVKAENIRLNFLKQSKQGWKIQAKIVWNTDAKLAIFEPEFTGLSSPTPVEQQARTYRNSYGG